MHQPPTGPLTYADPSTPRPTKRRLRLAVIAAVPVVLTPLIAAAMIAGISWKWLPLHFPCCNHPEVTIGTLVVLPGIGAVCGIVSVGRLAVGRRTLKGWPLAIVATVVNPALALAGFGMYSMFRA